jgi:glutathione S-transferase
MKLVLYYAPNTCATVPFITLAEAGANFQVKAINTRAGGNRTPQFLKLNPKHKVPVLVIDGKPLTENVAIQIWIHRNYPKAKLLPTDPAQNIHAISLMAFCASGIHPHLTPNARPQNYCDLPGSEESVKRVANKLLFEDFKVMDDLLARRQWFLPHFTAVDAYFFWCFRRGLSFKLDLSGFKNCMAHFKRMHARPSVKKVLGYEKQVMEAFAKKAA